MDKEERVIVKDITDILNDTKAKIYGVFDKHDYNVNEFGADINLSVLIVDNLIVVTGEKERFIPLGG